MEYFSHGKKNLILIYILFFVAHFGLIVGLFSIIMLYINRGYNTIYSSHYNFLIKHFWLTLIGIVVSFVGMFVLIGFAFMIVLVIWYYARLIFGLKYLLEGEPYPYPSTLWIK